jgi:cytochrome bd-type quinol oxidase subunit 2
LGSHWGAGFQATSSFLYRDFVGIVGVRPDLPARTVSNPFCWLGLLVVAVSTIALISGLLARRELRAFLGSNFLIAGLLITGGACIFPVMLYSTLAPENSLTAYAAAAGNHALFLASAWWPLGFALAIVYFVSVSRRYTKVARANARPPQES